MKTIKDVMTTDVVWVSPSARVKTAVILMKGHNIGVLPVVDANDAVVGIVTYQSILGEPQDAAVLDVMKSDFTATEPDTTIHDAADIMHEYNASHLLVMQDNKLVGIVSYGDLLPELGKTFDPLTELPWSDSFREWAMDALKRGVEISVLFFDLDQFGTFNKKYGHIVGDTVLKETANVFKKGINPALDLACRYGGDEFVVASIRSADETISLAEILKERISGISISEVPEGVSCSFGMSGGRRTREREDMHYAATIDDLVTRASKNCIANKPQTAPEPSAPTAEIPVKETAEPLPRALLVPEQGASLPRLKIQSVGFSSTGTEASVSVMLARDGQEFVREASGYILAGKNILRLIAEAAAGAVCKILSPGYGIVVDDVILQSDNKDEEIVTVVAVFISPRYSTRHAGSAVVKRGDQFRAAAAALLAAVNRQLEIAPQAVSVEIEGAE